jgi:hypothetical protein
LFRAGNYYWQFSRRAEHNISISWVEHADYSAPDFITRLHTIYVQVKYYAKKLIDVVSKDGGFTVGPITELDNTKPELVKIWVEFTRECGVYK